MSVASGGAGSGGENLGGDLPCPNGVQCFEVYPASVEGNTSTEGASNIATYPCATMTDEGGNELAFRLRTPHPGFVTARITDGDGVDIDAHLLETYDSAAPSGDACLARGDFLVSGNVEAGHAWILADTWVSASNGPQAGAFKLDFGYVAASEGPCDFEPGQIERTGDEGIHLALPAKGPASVAPHLVTSAEPAPFPTMQGERLQEHFAISESAVAIVWNRTSPWASGGEFLGAGVGDPSELSPEHEAWRVSMRWTAAARPVKGRRMLIRRGDDPTRAVVLAAGYDTGPQDLTHVAAITEEAHLALGTAAEAEIEIGFAADGTLPLGPRRCQD